MKHKTASIFISYLIMVSCAGERQPVDYVNPYIGNISHTLVPAFPTVHLPNSILRVYPERADYTSEYLDGLPVIVTNHRERSAFRIFVSNDEIVDSVALLSYDNEHITPYSFRVSLADGAIDAHYAVSGQSAMYEFKSLRPVNVSLYSMQGEVGYDEHGVWGVQTVEGDTRVYVYLQTLQKPVGTRILNGNQFIMDFDEAKVNLRYGVSFISVEQAKANLQREIWDYDMRALERTGRRIWNDALGRIKVKGGSEDQKTVFYTSYYRTFERPICMSEDGRYWSAFDASVHDDGGVPFYNDDWIWDTYRAGHPLRILMDREIEENVLRSFLRIAEQDGTGWMPTFPEVTGDSRRMNCNHAIAAFADAVAKGLDVDIEAACDASYKALTEKTLAPWSGKPAGKLDEFYWKNGYVAALRPGEKETDPVVNDWEKRQSVAVSLGTAYDCWCMSRIAQAAGRDSLAAFFERNSFNYRKLFNAETKFFHPKDASGAFVEDVDYDFPGGLGAREYYDENNAWVYRWDVQHNIDDLIALMGGDEAFCRELDRMFAEPLGRGKYAFYAKLPDHTGNVGQFSMGNEPSLHIPYLYNYAGAPWKTQKRVRQLLDAWFRNDVMGIPGDEDGGGLTPFVVFSSLGFYPVTPGKAEYAVGSPLFSKASVTLSNGKVFRIVAKNVSRENKYVSSVMLNGQALSRMFISHDDIMSGGTLVLEMTDRPQKNVMVMQ